MFLAKKSNFFKKFIGNKKKTNFRIVKDHSNISDMQSQAFETLKEKLNELETNLQREKDSYAQAQVQIDFIIILIIN